MNRNRHGGWLAGLVAAVALATAGTAAPGAEIRIWPTAVVTTDAVRLTDVAELRGFDDETAKRLGDLSVFAAPRAGGEVLVQAEDVRGALGEAGANLGEVQLIGAAGCHVSKPRPAVPPKATIRRVRATGVRPQPVRMQPQTAAARNADGTEGTLEWAMRQYITARFPEPGAKLSIRFSPASARDLKTPGAPERFDIRSRDERRLGLASFEVAVRDDESRRKVIPIVAEVSVSREVVVAKRPINRGQTIEGRDLKLEERDFTEFDSIGLTELAAAVGQSAREFIQPGEMVQPKSIEVKPLVIRGQPVTIWTRRGGLVIKTSGRAQAAGALGERIEVLRDGTRRKSDLIQATITGPGTVTLEPASQLALGCETKQ